MHALVLMANSKVAATPELEAQHVEFIGRLEQAHQVILGGGFEPPAVGCMGAYLIRCTSLEEARTIASSDPLVAADVVRCEVIEWQLVGFDPDAVDRSALLY